MPERRAHQPSFPHFRDSGPIEDEQTYEVVKDLLDVFEEQLPNFTTPDLKRGMRRSTAILRRRVEEWEREHADS